MSEALLIQTVASKTSGEIFAAIGVTYPAGSTCKCTNADGSVELEATGTDGTFIFNVPSVGDWEVSCTDGDSTAKETVSIAKQYSCESINLNYTLKTLSESTWVQIATASEAGLASTYWNIGDTKDITVNGETLTLAIMGFDHDDKADGSGKAGITFGLKNVMSETQRMNYPEDNVFIKSQMYSWMQNTLLTSLPSDLQAVLKKVNKKTYAGRGSDIINTNEMKLFLFSMGEIFGPGAMNIYGEGTQYSYFASNGAGGLINWWTRTPDVNGTDYYYVVQTDGSTTTISSDNSRRVRFGFCV